MRLFLTNQETRVEASDEEIGWLTGYLQFEDSSQSFYMSNGQVGYSGSKQRRLYNYHRKSFPAGLTAKVLRSAEKQGFPTQVFDMRTRPAEFDPSTDLAWLADRKLLDGTPFQLRAVERCLTRTRGILWLPTGSGKTEIACGIVKAVPDIRWIFLAPEADLMLNFAERYEKRTGEACGRVGDGVWKVDGCRVVSATFQTLSARLRAPDTHDSTTEFLAGFQGFIVDEVHQLPADNFYGVAMSIPNAYYRFGMSGTALARGDRRNMFIISALGEVIYRVPATELIAAKLISRPTIRFVPVVGTPPKNKTYNGAYAEVVVKSVARNRVLVRLAEKANHPALLFVKREVHGKTLLAELRSRGKVRVEFVHGKCSQSRRADLIRQLRWGDLDVVICTKVWQTGTDIPELASLIIGTAGASNIEAVQRVGRGTRVVHDSAGALVKDEVEVWEIYDQDPEEVSAATKRARKTRMKWFEDHSKSRMESYQMEGYPVHVLAPIEAVKYGVLDGK